MLGTSLAVQPIPTPLHFLFGLFSLLSPHPTLHYTPASFWDFTLIPNSHYFQWEFFYTLSQVWIARIQEGQMD